MCTRCAATTTSTTFQINLMLHGFNRWNRILSRMRKWKSGFSSHFLCIISSSTAARILIFQWKLKDEHAHHSTRWAALNRFTFSKWLAIFLFHQSFVEIIFCLTLWVARSVLQRTFWGRDFMTQLGVLFHLILISRSLVCVRQRAAWFSVCRYRCAISAGKRRMQASSVAVQPV